MITHRDALAQLAQAMIVEAVAQFRLAKQNNLQELAVVGFEVGQQANLFEQVFGQVLRLVNDEHRVPAQLDLFQQKFVDERQRVHPVEIEAARRQTEFRGNRLHQFIRVENGIQNQRGGKVAIELLEHRAAQCRLARAHLAGELHEAFALADAVKQMVQGLAVLAAVEKKTRVRRKVERRLL